MARAFVGEEGGILYDWRKITLIDRIGQQATSRLRMAVLHDVFNTQEQ